MTGGGGYCVGVGLRLALKRVSGVHSVHSLLVTSKLSVKFLVVEPFLLVEYYYKQMDFNIQASLDIVHPAAKWESEKREWPL